ncbi:MAG: LLM class flavin-dependent oxidoreductase [Acidimicrobiia bacterium]|nr:LLM class flavin-dependent oxidoreductase [Acidimicrobiia bacterium]
MRIGWATMGDLLPDPVTGILLTPAERHRMVVEAAPRAEEAGFVSASVGEHHFCSYIISSPPVLLAAMAERTSTLRLGTAVALGANNDPIRLAEEYATLDLLSGGRVDLVLGRGNLYEHTFHAFGQDPACSRSMYEENVGLVVEALHHEQITWIGEHRAPFANMTTQPRPVQSPFPVWIGGGSSMESVEFAAEMGLPLMLPGVFGRPSMFTPLAERYREIWAEKGRPPERCRVGAIAHTNVAATSQAARAAMEPRMTVYFDWLIDHIALSTPSLSDFIRPFDFDRFTTAGPTVCGSPQQVIERMEEWRDAAGLTDYLFMCDQGGMPPDDLFAMIDFAGETILPHFHA